jgi:hypothetical protein
LSIEVTLLLQSNSEEIERISFVQQTLLVFNEMVTTRQDFGCYRLVKAEDDLFIIFQRRYQLCSGPWVWLGCYYNECGSYLAIFHDTYLEIGMVWSQIGQH